ncbi:TraB/GumN family protein [Vibrio renipiscarius]|uniref:TraB/GumN family protein n=1 Tax=Vibrio renipiscarius TaxID=1461322 RepID=UPI00354C8F82
MTRLLCLLATLLISPLSYAEPLYWQASKGKLNLLLVGSVHVGDADMYPLPSAITTFLQHSDGLILEADIRNQQNIQYPRADKVSQDVLTQSQQKELLGIANLLNLNGQQLLQTPPWASALAIQMKQLEYLGYQAKDGVDLRLLSQAVSEGKPIIGLETLQFQIDLLTQQKNDGEELLTDAIEQFDHSENTTHCLIKSWKRGDIAKLNEFATLTEMSPEFEQAFIHQRNQDWAEKLAKEDMLPKKQGNYLVVVGTLHLIGESSLISLLQDQGFTITQRSKSRNANCEFKY